MLISFRNRNVGPMTDGELTFARRMAVVSPICEAAGLLREELQLFLSTHSPFVMAALKDEFASSDPESNKWFDFGMNMSIRQVDIVLKGNNFLEE